MFLSLLFQRATLSLTTFPTIAGWYNVVGISLATTTSAGITATVTGFIDLRRDWELAKNPLIPLSALLFPSLFEEVLWRGALLPHPSTTPMSVVVPWATAVLVIHVIMHPVAAATLWPRGRGLFEDPRFLILATMVLGGATASYIVSGGSAWAAAVTHGIPVALWRDFFGGERKLSQKGGGSDQRQIDHEG